MAISFTIETFLIRLGHLPIALARTSALVLYPFLHFTLLLPCRFLALVAAVAFLIAFLIARASGISRFFGTGCGVGHVAVWGSVG